ncbi:hypothetical protein [Chryseobacterium sp. WLY505]|uniref:hypothetical protein n=1 Tax=Chryseobacterium sp. WLY505 TaxID=3068892 RepID=UPI0027967858|nr:hypothetical protein [Chryseobacterium sp. WLY505]MDQ1855739.1 hypothetical protein [Chryseobacterium sp. WLY505]
MNCKFVLLKNKINKIVEKFHEEYDLSNDQEFILRKILEGLKNHPPDLSLDLCSKLISGPVIKEKYSNLDNPI